MASDSKYACPRGGRDRLPGPGLRLGPADGRCSAARPRSFLRLLRDVRASLLSLCRKLLVTGLTRLRGVLTWVSAHLHGRSRTFTLEHLFQSTELQSSGFWAGSRRACGGSGRNLRYGRATGTKVSTVPHTSSEEASLLDLLGEKKKKAPGCFRPALLGPGCGFPGSADILMEPGKTPA